MRRVVAPSAGSRFVDGVVVAAMAVVAAGMAALAAPARAWIPDLGSSTATPAHPAGNGVDLAGDTHQWATSRGLAILATDGHDAITRFLDQPDPSAPTARDPATGALLGRPEPYSWRLLLGARDADGVLHPQLRDHLHNFWTHHGRRWILGPSAATGAEAAFTEAVTRWSAGDRAQALYWLGASLHLVQDACVPQHNFFGVGVYHRDYERWVLGHHDQLAVTRGGIYRSQFRTGRGHGGTQWSSAHPRGWVDECAHRSARQLRSASHADPKHPGPGDPQWRTRDHIAALQQLSAGYIAFFFEEVQGP